MLNTVILTSSIVHFQLTMESGITDEPDLTLLSVTSDMTGQDPGDEISGEITHRSDGTSGGDSILSFEQHEQSMRSSPDRDVNDSYFQDLAGDETQRHIYLKDEIFKRNSNLMPRLEIKLIF